MNKEFISAFIKPFTPVIQNSFFGYALSQAILEDYADVISKITNENTEVIKERILKNTNLKVEKLKDNSSWKENE